MKENNYDLIKKSRDGTATEEEKAELLQWYRDVANRESEFPEDEHEVDKFMRQRLIAATNRSKKTTNPFYWVAAASITAMLGVAGYYLSGKFTANLHDDRTAVVKPTGINKTGAILILADGSQIDLSDSKASAHLPVQTGVRISRISAEEIQYSALTTGDHEKDRIDNSQQYNTIKIPAGRQFAVVLSDGTKVWLNAKSVFKFPVNASLGKERLVNLTGEGYFEVHHNKQQPFRVSSKEQVVEVLGTHFNIHAFAEEAVIKTTLLEGSVKVNSKNKQVKLHPGQEATLLDNFKVADVNTANAIAWKDGHFRFEDERLETIMNAIARWYDVKVVYQNADLKNELFGILSDRSSDIGTLLKIMSQTSDIRFSIKEKTVYVAR